jgi:hypothetical protein
MISEFFDCILERRPFDEDRATRQARRMREAALDPSVAEAMRDMHADVTQELPAVFDEAARSQLDDDALDTLTPDWREHNGAPR